MPADYKVHIPRITCRTTLILVILGDGFLKIDTTKISITYRFFRSYVWVKFGENRWERMYYDLTGVARGTFMSFGRVCITHLCGCYT
jgi:hypothetical protein